MSLPPKEQRDYYKKTAESYDEMHCHQDDAHYRALNHIEILAKEYKINSFLDVGSGTGRCVEYFLDKKINVVGIEPSQELRDAGIKRNPKLKDHLLDGNGYEIPFPNKSFDAVCEFGVLHHVQHPDKVLQEMIRVARKAIFISDSNRFGQGSKWIRLIKFLIWKANLWPIANYIKTKGKGYIITEGDGLSYSYSVYDSYKTLSAWADTIIEIPTETPFTKSRSKRHILHASHVLLVGLKQ